MPSAHAADSVKREDESDEEIVLLDKANVNQSAFRRRAEKEGEFLLKQALPRAPTVPNSPVTPRRTSGIHSTPKGKGKGRENADPSSSPLSLRLALGTSPVAPRSSGSSLARGAPPDPIGIRSGLRKRTLSEFMDEQEQKKKHVTTGHSDPAGPTGQFPSGFGLAMGGPGPSRIPQSSPTRKSYYRTFSDKALDVDYMARHGGAMEPPAVPLRKVAICQYSRL